MQSDGLGRQPLSESRVIRPQSLFEGLRSAGWRSVHVRRRLRAETISGVYHYASIWLKPELTLALDLCSQVQSSGVDVDLAKLREMHVRLPMDLALARLSQD